MMVVTWNLPFFIYFLSIKDVIKSLYSAAFCLISRLEYFKWVLIHHQLFVNLISISTLHHIIPYATTRAHT